MILEVDKPLLGTLHSRDQVETLGMEVPHTRASAALRSPLSPLLSLAHCLANWLAAAVFHIHPIFPASVSSLPTPPLPISPLTPIPFLLDSA